MEAMETTQLQQQKALSRIYLDHCATTPLDSRVLAIMLPFFSQNFGNPASQSHAFGWQAERAVDKARNQVADALGASHSREILFTSGATESCAIALNGVIRSSQLSENKKRRHVLSTELEHSAVHAFLTEMHRLGEIDLEFLPVNEFGQVEPAVLKKHLKSDTLMVSLMWANNEIGSLNAIRELASIAGENGVLFHTDATQAIGKLPVELKNLNVDLLSLSGHKVYGPKGVGALYVKKGLAQLLAPLYKGGGQEEGLRPGTLNVPGIVGLGEALRIACEDQELKAYQEKMQLLQSFFLKSLGEKAAYRLLGHPCSRIPGHLSLVVKNVKSYRVLANLPELALSTQSACQGLGVGNRVHRALGLNDEDSQSTLRICFGRFNTPEEAQKAGALLATQIQAV